jgi:uncharacterized glyoxalase superfamily metalloenzyme YdcJ
MIEKWQKLNGHHKISLFFPDLPLLMGRHQRDSALSERSDKAQIDRELGGFRPRDSAAVREFMAALGKRRHRMIVVICGQIAELESLPPLTRIQKKSKELLQKWIDDNWPCVAAHFGEFTVDAQDGTLL